MIKIAICEDQKNIGEETCQRLMSMSKAIGLKCEVALFSTGEELLCAVEQKKYDIYYLDIDLNNQGIDGYLLSKEIRKKQRGAILIFLSGHDEYACSAFEVNALRFLRKPVEEKKFKEAFDKALQVLNVKQECFYYMSDYLEKEIELKEILYFESQGRKIIMNKTGGEQEVFYSTMKALQKKLEKSYFYLCHKSYLVNFTYISKINANLIILENGVELPISRTFKNGFKEKYANYLFMLDEEVK